VCVPLTLTASRFIRFFGPVSFGPVPRSEPALPPVTAPLSSPAAPRARPVSDCGRAALRRVLFIHERLGNQQPETARSLAEKLETSERTIKRDLEFMRDQLGAPIAWDGAAHTYTYSRPCDLLPLLRLDAGEALALAVAGRTFAAWHGTPLGRALTAALGKIAGVIGGAVSVPVSEIGQFVFHPDSGAAAESEHHHFATILEAIRRRRVLRLAYQKPRAGAAPEKRMVHPLHLACLDHRWVLVAHDPARHAPRNFLLARIREAVATVETFEPPAGFDLPAYLRGSVGRFTGEKEIEIRLAFDATAAPYVRERPWHSSQTLVEKPHDAVEVTLRLNNLTDIARRVLACGRHVEVLAPAELRETIRTEALALAAQHAPTRT
jgi:predicted DNA-binding transcriptional regulator YafY